MSTPIMNVPARNLYPLVLLLVLAACTVNPFRTAQTAEQKGDALYGQYVIAKEQGALLLENTTISDGQKLRLAQAMVASKDVADSLQDALIQYSTIKGQLESGDGDARTRLAIAEQNIGAWIVQSQPIIDELVAAVGGLR